MDPDIRRLQQSLSDIDAKLGINHGQEGRGKIVIQYNTLDELDGILEQIR